MWEHLQKEIDDIFDEGLKRSEDFDTQFVLKQCQNYFDEHCAEGGKLDPRPTETQRNGNAVVASHLYRHTAFRFVKVEMQRRYAAERLLLEGWAKFNAIQRETGRKTYKGLLAFTLVQFYEIVFGDIGAAARWALLTHADDALVGHNQEGMGTDRLRYAFGMSEQALSQFNAIIEPNQLHDHMTGWSESNRFPDDMLVKFMLNYPQYAHLFTIPTSALEFPPSIPYLDVLREDLNKSRSPKQTTEQGDALEYLAAYLFLLIPGLIPRRKVVPETKDFEHDLVVSNWRSSGNLEAELFGRDFLVECKNWKSSVGVSAVGYFLYRMKLTHTKFGVIFAKSGISGEDEEFVYARNLCQRAFHEDGSLCIVVEDKDITGIIDGRTTFRSLLMEKSNELQFGKPKAGTV